MLGACGNDSDDDSDGGAGSVELSIADAWSRQPAEGQPATAVYGTVSNPGDEGVMQMSEVEDGFVVPAGGDFTFEPGGPHIMMLGIDAATYPTDTVDVILEMDNATTLAFDAEVRALDGDGMEGMDDGDMEDMSEDEMSEMGDSEMSEDDMSEDEG